jgi:drug/metabolite transporter (DMT)-like permease
MTSQDTTLSVKSRIHPAWTLAVGVVGISTGAIFVRLADAPALVIAAYRLGLTLLVLLPLAAWKAAPELRRLSRREVLIATLSGLFLALHFATWIASLDYTSVANSVIFVNTIPIWVGLLSPLVTHERVGRHVAIGILFSVAGSVIVGLGPGGLDGSGRLGDGLALAGGFFAALYILLGRTLRQRISLLAYTTVCYGSAAVFLWLMVLALRLPVTGFSPKTWWAFLGLALVSQGLGHTSYNWALKWLSAGVIAVALLGEPVGSTILAWFLLGEKLTVLKAAGGALILYGIYRAARGRRSGTSTE